MLFLFSPTIIWCLFCLLLQILVLNTNTQELVASFRVTTGTSNTTAIKSIEFARKGRWEATECLLYLDLDK